MSDTQYRVNVYGDEERDYVVARVRYNTVLDYWSGRNWENGGTGRHKGITKLRDGRYVIIYGTDWQGESDYGLVVDKDDALQEILKSQNSRLLDTKKFVELKEYANKQGMLDSEYDDEEQD